MTTRREFLKQVGILPVAGSALSVIDLPACESSVAPVAEVEDKYTQVGYLRFRVKGISEQAWWIRYQTVAAQNTRFNKCLVTAELLDSDPSAIMAICDVQDCVGQHLAEYAQACAYGFVSRATIFEMMESYEEVSASVLGIFKDKKHVEDTLKRHERFNAKALIMLFDFGLTIPPLSRKEVYERLFTADCEWSDRKLGSDKRVDRLALYLKHLTGYSDVVKMLQYNGLF